jgi:hypothetical protein
LRKIVGEVRVVVRFQTLERVVKDRIVRHRSQVPRQFRQRPCPLRPDPDQVGSGDKVECVLGLFHAATARRLLSEVFRMKH